MSARHCMAVVISALSMLVVPANIVSAQGGAPLGSWQLDAERSMRTPALPGPPAQSPTIRVFEDWGDGLVFVTNNGVDGEGDPTGNRIIFRRDARDYPIAARNQPGYVTIAFEVTSTTPWSADYTIKVNGEVGQTATESISADGQTMTVTVEGMDAQGPFTQTQVFVKQ